MDNQPFPLNPGDHGEWFRWVDATAATRLVEREPDGARFQFRFLNGVPLNAAYSDREVNFLACSETRPDGRTRPLSWVTDLEITASHAVELLRAGRARWRIEHESFKPLKHPGDGFEHHCGHGRPPRATGFAHRMRWAFLIDPVPQRGGSRCQAARAKSGSVPRRRRKWRGWFLGFHIPDWETLYPSIACGHHKPDRAPGDTA